MATFQLRINGGDLVKTFEADTFGVFVNQIAHVLECVNDESLSSFFYDTFQVKVRISQRLLVCRVK